MATRKPKYPGNPHLWRHTNGRWYIKTTTGRRAIGATDLSEAKAALDAHLSSLTPIEYERSPTPKGKPAPHLWQHPNGTFYIMYYNLVGKQSRKSCNTKSEDEAKADLNRYLAALEKPIKPEKITTGAILDGYLDDHGPRTADYESLKSNVAALKYDLADLYPSDVTGAVIRRYAENQQERGIGEKPRSAGTVLKDVGILRAAFKWAVDNKWITAAEKPTFPAPVKRPPPRDRWLTRAEYARLLDACEAQHVRMFVVMALHTTKRATAILTRKWTDVRGDLLYFGEGVGNKNRGDVPINAVLSAELDRARRLATTGHIIEYGGAPVESVKTGFRGACERAGLNGVTPHTLRHTGATWLAMAGVPMAEIARLLGDSVKVTEQTYAKYHPDYLRRAVDALAA